MSTLRTLVLGMCVLALAFPFGASAATKPTCTLELSTSAGAITVRGEAQVYVREGEELRISWKSKNATRAYDRDGARIALSGSATVTPETSTAYAYRFTSGRAKAVCEVRALAYEGDISAASLTQTSSKPVISGTLEGVKKVEVSIRSEGSKKPLYTKKNVKVSKGKWKLAVPKKLADGVYTVEVRGEEKIAFNTLLKGTLTVGKSARKEGGPLIVGFVPLLFGGTARAGESVPVSYLQMTNTGTEPLTVRGFYARQNGTAPQTSIVALSTVDDKGGSRGSTGGAEGKTPFDDLAAHAPTDVIFAPGQMRLFTIKATLAPDAASYAGKNLKIDVTGIDTDARVKGAFPIKGTTWTIR